MEVATDWAVTQFVNKDTNWAVAQFDNKGTDGSVAQFDNKGNETDDSRYRRLGCLQNGPGPEWGPWELRERDREAEKATEAEAKEAFDIWCGRMFSTLPQIARPSLMIEGSTEIDMDETTKTESVASGEYTVCSLDGSVREIHKIDCNCHFCVERRKQNQEWRDAGW